MRALFRSLSESRRLETASFVYRPPSPHLYTQRRLHRHSQLSRALRCFLMSICQTMSSNSLHNSGPQSVATLPSNRGSADSALSSNPQPTQEGTLSASVSSLMALALSTLRTKRRREGTPSQQVPAKLTNPRDSAVPNSVFLDYGSETNDLPDSSQSPPSSSKDSPKDTQDNNQPSKSQAAEELREEGEISDEEAPSVAPTPPSSRETQKLRSHPQELPTSVISTPVMSSRKIYPQKSPQVVHGEYTTRNIVPSATAQPHNPWNDWIPSQNHVRPGLKSESLINSTKYILTSSIY